MRRKLSLLLTVALTAAMLLVGCGGSDDKSSTTDNSGIGIKQNGSINVSGTNVDDVANIGGVDTPATVTDITTDVPDVVDVPDFTQTTNTGYASIEAYLSDPDINAQYQQVIDSTLAQFGDYYSAISIQAFGNDVYYNYYIAAGDYESLYAAFAGQDGTQMCKDAKQALYQECGVMPSSLTFTYYTSDGTPVASWTD